MEMIIDFVLLTASGAAVFYCVMLSSKLEKLRDTKNGLGATIATMSGMVEQARFAVQAAKSSSAQSIETLSPLISETNEIIPKLNELIDVVSELSEIAVNDVNEAAAAAAASLDAQTETARMLIAELKKYSEKREAFSRMDPDGPHSAAESNTNIAYLEAPDSPGSAAARIQNSLVKARQTRNARNTAG